MLEQDRLAVVVVEQKYAQHDRHRQDDPHEHLEELDGLGLLRKSPAELVTNRVMQHLLFFL